MCAVPAGADRSMGEALARTLCVFLFEGGVSEAILRRWLLYAPQPKSNLKTNICVLLRAICLSPVRVEMASTHLQVFDCPALRIVNETIADSAPVMAMLKALCAYFRGQCVNNAQREVTLRAFEFDDLLQRVICRRTLLFSAVEAILTDARCTPAYVAVREMVLLSLTDLYTDMAAASDAGMVADAITAVHMTMRAKTSVFQFPRPLPNCALTEPWHCIVHCDHERRRVQPGAVD